MTPPSRLLRCSIVPETTACSGVPVMATAGDDHQQRFVTGLRQHGTVVGAADDRHRLLRQIRRLINDADHRQQMSDAGIALIDGHGPARVSRRLLASQIQFRAATPRDTSQLFTWRNDPEVRSVSFNHHPIAWDSHQQWLEQTLREPDCLQLIASERGGRPLGQIRFDLDSARQSAQLSISIDSSRRGRGLGTVVLEHACGEAVRRWPELRSITAMVRPENVAAINMLGKAGFDLASAVATNGHPARRFERVFDTAVGSQSLRRSA